MKKITQQLFKKILLILSLIVCFLSLFLIVYLLLESRLAVKEIGWDLINPQVEWRPLGVHPSYSLFKIILGTLYVTVLAVTLSLLFGTSTALLLSYYLPENIAKILLSFIQTIAGIPSVIFGFVGLTVFVKWFEENLSLSTGECVLVASLILMIMLLPYVISTLVESIHTIRSQYEPLSLAVGISKEHFLLHLLLPKLAPSLLTAMMLAFGRGLGETMAVMMVVGNSPIWPKLLGRAETLSALTALEMGGVEYGSIHLSALYFANVILVLLVMMMFGGGLLLRKRLRETHEETN